MLKQLCNSQGSRQEKSPFSHL